MSKLATFGQNELDADALIIGTDLDFIEQCLTEEERTYNSTQLAAKLEAERGVTLSPDWIRQLLKKRLSLETHPPESSTAPRPRSQSPCRGPLD